MKKAVRIGLVTLVVGLSLVAITQVRKTVRSPVKNSIYKILNNNKGSVGTGFAIQDRRGRKFLVTNYHVCHFARMALSNYFFAEQETKPTTLPQVVRPILASIESDVCVLSAPSDAVPLPLASRLAKRGDIVTTVGHPGGGDMAESSSVVISGGETMILPVDPAACGAPSGVMAECYGKFEAGLLNTPAQGGQSGSPILNEQNEVVGILFASDHYSVTMYIPLDQLAPIIAFLDLLE